MATLRDIMSADPQLRPALKYSIDDPTLSGREAALARVVACLCDDFDALDGEHQDAIIKALAVQADKTRAAESYVRRLFQHAQN